MFIFEQMIDQIYLNELKLRKANSACTGAPFLIGIYRYQVV